MQSLIFEYRDGPEETAPLIAASITDVLRDGFGEFLVVAGDILFDGDAEGEVES
ncbi:MAG: hypothetical protein HC938_17490 [Nitrospira sp.]|nr:hypothetical protein [Nitrospira sp.]